MLSFPYTALNRKSIRNVLARALRKGGCFSVTSSGDSGGIVYTYHNSHYAVVGIHQGSRYSYSDNNYYDPTKNWGIATKAHNVYNVMGIVPY